MIFTAYGDHPSWMALELARRYGSAVEILEPEEARKQMWKEVERMARLYRAGER